MVVGISPDSIDSHNQFITKFNLPFMLLADQQKETMKAYGAWGPRKMPRVKSRKGPIRSTALIGPDGTIKKHWIPVTDPGAHPAEVLEFLRIDSGIRH